LVFCVVICSAENSKISSERSLRMTMLFSQMVRLACDDVTISGMKVGQLCGLLRKKGRERASQ